MKNAFEAIYEIVAQIPYGTVASYGQVARLAGNPRMSRVVGYAMHAAPEGLPCHRVVNREGGLSEAFTPDGKRTHRQRLEAEGVLFTADGRVDMEKCAWLGKP